MTRHARGAAGRVGALALVAALGAACAGPAADGPVVDDGGAPDGPWRAPLVDACRRSYQGIPDVRGVLPGALVEISGLVASPSGQRVLWAHNDSGDRARLFALAEDGAPLGELALPFTEAVDVEDLAAGPCPDGSGPCLLVADTGDNVAARDAVALHFVPEPALDEDAPFGARDADAHWSVTVRYVDGPVDVEAVVLTPDGAEVFLIEKIDGPVARVFVVAGPFDDGAEKTATVATTLDAPGVDIELGRTITAADLHPSGAALVVRVYTGIFEYRGTASDDVRTLLAQAPTTVTFGPLDEPQGEAIAYAREGTALLSASEDPTGAGGQPLHAYPCE